MIETNDDLPIEAFAEDIELGICPYCGWPMLESQVDDSRRGLHGWCAEEAFDE